MDEQLKKAMVDQHLDSIARLLNGRVSYLSCISKHTRSKKIVIEFDEKRVKTLQEVPCQNDSAPPAN